MTQFLTPQLAAAVRDTQSGATEVARQVVDGLIAISDDRHRLEMSAEAVAGQLRWCAPMWHIVRASTASDPRTALLSLRERLDFATDRSVDAAAKFLAERGRPIRIVPGSDVVARVLALLPEASVGGPIGLVGADAVSPGGVLNAVGTRELAASVPTVVVATSLKAVPQNVFDDMTVAGFEQVPLDTFEAIVLDGDVFASIDAGRRVEELTS